MISCTSHEPKPHSISEEGPCSELPKKPRIDKLYQALCKKDHLMWSPENNISDEALNQYIIHAEEMHDMNVEQSLQVLLYHDFDVKQACLDLTLKNGTSTKPSKWTVAEEAVFDKACKMYGNDFSKIHELLPNKEIKTLVEYYYSWKHVQLSIRKLDKDFVPRTQNKITYMRYSERLTLQSDPNVMKTFLANSSSSNDPAVANFSKATSTPLPSLELTDIVLPNPDTTTLPRAFEENSIEGLSNSPNDAKQILDSDDSIVTGSEEDVGPFRPIVLLKRSSLKIRNKVQNQGNPLTIKAEDNRDDGTTSDASILKISGDLGKDFKPMIRFMNKRKYIYRKTLQNKEPLKLPANIKIASAVTRPRLLRRSPRFTKQN